jgi:thiol-disulfide isomerase/thioredoxin
LGCPLGTVLSRLSRAREQLRHQLTRRGLALSVGLATTLISERVIASLPPASLVTATSRIGTLLLAGSACTTGLMTAKVVLLTEAMMKNFILTKLRIAAAAMLFIGVAGLCAGLAAHGMISVEDEHTAKQEAPQSAPAPRQQANKEPQKGEPFPSAPACKWLFPPWTGFGGTWATCGVACIIDNDKDGAKLTYARPFPKSEKDPEHRLVVFDAAGNRYLPKAVGHVGSDQLMGSGVMLQRFRLDSVIIPFDKVTTIGVELVYEEAHKLAAKEALANAKAAGIEVLPYPQVGESFEFELTSIDGKKIRSADMKGNVVLIDCWATWCSPCMAKMPELKKLYERRHKDGFEIIGINHDQDLKIVRKACKEKALTWPHVQAPTEEKASELWSQSAHIGSLPRLLLIDREGVLRADCGMFELEHQVERLLGGTVKSKP